MRKLNNQKKIICAMSGGIDSSVAAALLKRAGFDVIGVFMKFWVEPKKNDLVGTRNRYCSLEAERKSRKVARILNIPFYVLNFEKEFKREIVDNFLREIKRGQTPNPCVVCNKKIKFGLLLKKARTLGADYVATGHYARLKEGKEGIQLFRGKDKEKDQSYFLWQLNQKQLKHIFFPVGNLTKTEVKKMAKSFKLPIFKIPESMEICFILTNLNNFLKRYLKSKPGKIITKRKVIGEHQGLWFHTIGQRKGIGIAGGPYYVLDKDLKKNLLIVTTNKKDLYKKELQAQNINWISEKKPKLPLKVKVKIRYRHKLTLATIKPFKKGTVRIIFDKPQRAITSGQSVVFYKGQEVLGGGMIS